MKLDDLIAETKRAKTPEPDWKSIDEKLFATLEQERPQARLNERETQRGRVVWIGAAITLAAAAAALVFVHPTRDGQNTSEPTQAIAQTDRVDVTDHVAYFESKNAAGETAVRWSSQPGSVIHVEHAQSPLVLSLDEGVAEAQVTPVPSGEAFAIDVTSSSGNVVRVAVHGTHLRVARDGDKVVVDLTEGVVSIGVPPRRGSTIGTLVTAPAHVELDARDLASVRIDHNETSVRAAERVTAPEPQIAVHAETPVLTPDLSPEALLDTTPHDVRSQTQATVHSQPQTTNTTSSPTISNAMITSETDLASAIAACGKNGVAPQTTFTTTLTLQVADNGSVQAARFHPPLLPEARDCAANVIYKRTKLAASGAVEVPIAITR